jgi:hypothetical protein
MLLGLIGGAIFALGWWYLFSSGGKRYRSIGLALLFAGGGWMQGLQSASSLDAMPTRAFASAIVGALVGFCVGAVIDLWRHFRKRGLATVKSETSLGQSAGTPRSNGNGIKPNNANHEVLGASPDAGPEEITAAYQAMMQNHQRQPETEVTPAPSPPYSQGPSRSTTSHGSKTILNLGLFLVIPIAVVIIVVWLGSNSVKTNSASEAATQPTSVAADECYSLVEAQNYEEAITPCRQAAEQGDAGAQVNLGWMYETGSGLAQNDNLAVSWYYRAAVQGLATAQYNLGLMYDNGRGVSEDDGEAAKWYRLAAAQGDADAKARLEELRLSENLETSTLSLFPDPEARLTRDDFVEAERIARAGYTNAKVSHLVGPGIPREALYNGFIIGLYQGALIMTHAPTAACRWT